MAKRIWDAFLCHASEDKAEFVEPLASELNRLGLKVWYDKFVLKVGDSLRRKIEHGLSRSRFGIVVLSHSFFNKNWGREELDGLFTLQMEGRNQILPIWHGVTKAEVISHSPIIAGRFALNSAEGIGIVARELLKVIKPGALKFEEMQRRAKNAGVCFADQIAKIHPGIEAEVVIGSGVGDDFANLSFVGKPRMIGSILREGVRIDFKARNVAEYNKKPIKAEVTLKQEALEKILAAQRTGHSITLSDEVLNFSAGPFSELFPHSVSGSKLTISPIAARFAKKLNFRVCFKAGEQVVQYERIEFTPERVGTEEVELLSTAPTLPIEIRLELRLPDLGARFRVRTKYSGHDIRDILKADLAVSILVAGGKIDLVDLDSGRTVGSLEHGGSETREDRAALSRFIQACYDVALAFGQPLRWAGNLDENEYFKASCLAEIVRKGTLELPLQPMRINVSEDQAKQMVACATEHRTVRFQRPIFYEANSIFGTSFEVGAHFIYFTPDRCDILSSSSTGVDLEVAPSGSVIFEFPRFRPAQENAAIAETV